MRPSTQTYGQPEKKETRQRVIAHAVANLSKKRSSSPVVTIEGFERMMDYCLRCLEKSGVNIRDAVRPHLEDWLALHHSRVGKKKAEDLNVLFLAGPDPIPDLMAFKRCGVSFHNIWAIERDEDTFAIAVETLGREGLNLKLHNGNLQDFFSIVPQQFDIVYLDFCGSLFGGRPGTIHVLRELLVSQRLAPLSALITNFCEPVPQSDGLGDLICIKQGLDQNPSRNPAAAAVQSMLTASQTSENVRKWARLLAVWELAYSDSETRSEYFEQNGEISRSYRCIDVR
ncbi:MAG: hypothetical protein L0Z50_15215 [Verrucomicrobiales bacterium]|nr:hypothetical protein [Verrucomicrobiales bacterium]